MRFRGARSTALALILVAGLCPRTQAARVIERSIRPHYRDDHPGNPSKGYVDSLDVYLRSPDRDVRFAALDVAGRPGIMRASLVPLVAAALHERDELVLLAALRALSRFETPATLAALGAALQDDWSGVRSRAAQLLGRMGPRALPAVPTLVSGIAELPMLRARDCCEDRCQMILALGNIGDRSAIPAIRRNLLEGDADVRVAAAHALLALSPGARVPPGDSLRTVIFPHSPLSLLGADSVPHRREFQLAEVHVRMHRTRCYGSCPDYTVDLFGDGRARYSGREFAPRKGEFLGHVPPEKVRELLDFAEAIDFFGLEGRYSYPVTDSPTTFVEIRLGSQGEQVELYPAGPASISRLEELIDVVAKHIAWAPTPADSTH